MPRLDYVRVEGFKSIAEAEVELRALNVLIGANGAGKSNFVGLFDLLQALVDGRLQTFVSKAGGPEALFRNGLRATAVLVVQLTFDGIAYEARLEASDDGGVFFQSEACTRDDDSEVEDFGGGHRESELPEGPEGQGTQIFQQGLELRRLLRSVRVHHFHDTSSLAPMKGLCDVDDNRELRRDASNLAAFLYLLESKHPNQFRLIVETVRLVAPFFDSFVLKPSAANEQKIRLEWRAKGTEKYFNAHALSDGTLRFICLATLLLQPDPPKVIVIDEPELGLHPYAIVLLANMLKTASARSQVIVSTQSVSLVNEFDPSDLIVVDAMEDGSRFHRPTPEEVAGWLDRYSLGELWEKNVLGGRPQR